MNLATLLKKAFDYEHWLDPSLQVRNVKELWLEHIWPIDPTAGAQPRESDSRREARP
jgi:hypothetical protein